MTRLNALSISSSVHEQMREPPFAGQVLAAFRHALVLTSPAGNIVSLVQPQIGNGPLNIVVDGGPEVFLGLSPETRSRLEDGRLCVGRFEVALTDAMVWDPRPYWLRLRARHAAIIDQLPHLRTVSLVLAPGGSLLPLVSVQAKEDRADEACVTTAVFQTAQQAAHSLRAGWDGDLRLLESGAARLAGLGTGLTPAGDDFLAGMMLRAWLEHPQPVPFCGLLLEVAAPQTTAFSAALLRAASRGECNAAWHQLLAALDSGSPDLLTDAARLVLAYGSTSGADTLAGFLWLDSDPGERTD